MTSDGDDKTAAFCSKGANNRRDMVVVTLSAVSLWMSPQWSRSCRGYSSSMTSNYPPAQCSTSAMRHKGRLEKVWYGVTIGCSACSDIAVQEKTSKRHAEEFRKRITNVCMFTNADEMWNLRCKRSREKMRAIPHLWCGKMLRPGESAPVKR